MLDSVHRTSLVGSISSLLTRRQVPLAGRRTWGAIDIRSATIAVAVLSAGAFVRFYGLSWQSLWFDEAFSWRMVQFSWADIVRRTADDVHPPLYYFVLKFWTDQFGDTAFAMRSLSAITDILLLPILYGFVLDLYRLGGEKSGTQASEYAGRVGIFSMTLAALSISRIVLAREARMYPLGCLLAVVSSWMLWRCLFSSRGRLWGWAGYVVSAVGLCYTHNYGLFTVAAQAIFALGVAICGRFRSGRVSGAGLSEVSMAFSAVALGFAPWLPTLIWQGGRVAEGYWLSNLNLRAFHGLFEQWFTPERQVHEPVTGGAATLGFVVLMAAYGRGWRADRVYVLLLVFTPLILGLGSSVIQGQNVITGIYLAFAFPFFLVAIADLVQRIPVPAARTIVSLLLVANMVFQDWYCWRQADIANRPGLRSAVGLVQAQFRRGDLVMCMEPYTMLAASYYFGTANKPRFLIDGDRSYELKGASVYLDSDGISVAELLQDPPRRVWLLSSRSMRRRKFLPEEWQLISYWSFPDAAPRRWEVDVRLFRGVDR
jgi:mannosyltransferase